MAELSEAVAALLETMKKAREKWQREWEFCIQHNFDFEALVKRQGFELISGFIVHLNAINDLSKEDRRKDEPDSSGHIQDEALLIYELIK